MREIFAMTVLVPSAVVLCLSMAIAIIGLLVWLGPLFFLLVTPLAAIGVWWALREGKREIDEHYAARRWWERK